MRGLQLTALLLLAACIGAVCAVLTIYVLIMQGMPELRPWHEPLDAAEFREADGNEDFRAYLQREDELFAELDAEVKSAGRKDLLSRYARGSYSDPTSFSPSPPASHNWNRSFVIEPGEIRAGAVLLHGLSDSPYTMHSIAELLAQDGFYVVSLRIPGHGTVPGDLKRVHWRDWREAVRVATRWVDEKVGSRPLWIVGYSNGGALAVDYALASVENAEQRPADQLVLFAPAIAVSPVASLARLQRGIAELPTLQKLAWTEILPEYDPFKYNSFPVAAGEQIYGLTSQLEERLVRAEQRGLLDRFPPVLVFSSVVDATIPARAVSDQLLARLPANGSQLIVFDVNRLAGAEGLLTTRHESYLRYLEEDGPFPYEVTIVTNATPDTERVVARTRAAMSPASRWTSQALDLEWPRSVYSLSHTSMTLPASDPLYGAGRGEDDRLRLGAVEVRGERGVFGVPMDLLMRLRYNPFFPYVEERIVQTFRREDRP